MTMASTYGSHHQLCVLGGGGGEGVKKKPHMIVIMVIYYVIHCYLFKWDILALLPPIILVETLTNTDTQSPI